MAPSWSRAGPTIVGEYSFTNLMPGTYVVCACGRDPIPFDWTLLTTLAAQPLQLLGVAGRALSVGGETVVLDSTLRTFAPTSFPNTSTVAESTRLVLGPGDERRGVDLTTVPVRAVRVSGTITGGISPLTARWVRLVPAGETDEASMVSGYAPVLVQPDGRFDFASVPPGQYVLRVQHYVTSARGGGSPSGSALMFLGARGIALTQPPPGSPAEPLLWANEPIAVGQEHIQGLSIALRPGTPIRGRLQFVGASAPPTPQLLTRSVLVLQRIAIDPAQVGFVPTAPFVADGTFSIGGAMPGRYVLGAAMPGWPTLKSVVAGGVDITDTGLDVGSTEINDVVLTFTDARQAAIDGQLIEASKAATEELTALLIPSRSSALVEACRGSRPFPILCDRTQGHVHSRQSSGRRRTTWSWSLMIKWSTGRTRRGWKRCREPLSASRSRAATSNRYR